MMLFLVAFTYIRYRVDCEGGSASRRGLDATGIDLSNFCLAGFGFGYPVAGAAGGRSSNMRAGNAPATLNSSRVTDWLSSECCAFDEPSGDCAASREKERTTEV